MMFPIIASCALFGLYIFFHIFSKEYINLLLSFYFLVLGIFALSHMMSPVILKLVPSAVPVIPFHLKFTQVRRLATVGQGDRSEPLIWCAGRGRQQRGRAGLSVYYPRPSLSRPLLHCRSVVHHEETLVGQ